MSKHLSRDPEYKPVAGLGATPVTHTETHFRVWAPHRKSVAVEVEHDATGLREELIRSDCGYFVGEVTAGPGSRYRYVLDESVVCPDPASMYQPDGVHGPSQIVDHQAFAWTDQAWQGVPKENLVIYELHIGAFTKDGTFRSAIERLSKLLALGVTAVELMPVTQSPGRWNWGYDGVDLFAVRNTYGEPHDFKAFVDACHDIGLAVILDVVYNHLGPEGNYLGEFGPYLSTKHHTPWGAAFNLDGRNAEQVRRFIVDNAIFWLDVYHIDGLRLDAVHAIQDESTVTILDEIRQAVSKYAESVHRAMHLIAETNVYDDALLTEKQGRSAFDAIWCDCLMYSVYSHAMPGLQLTQREYCGASDLAEALRYGYLYTGRTRRRVSAREREDRLRDGREKSNLKSLVTSLQTHDAVGNQPKSKRIHQLTSTSFQKAAAALTLLYPSIPLIFMGEEFAADSPFPFFVDFEDVALCEAVQEGRLQEYPQNSPGSMISPCAAEAFNRAKLSDEDNGSVDMLGWYRDLLAFRARGIADGWLSASCMESGYDAENTVFWLRFECREASQVLIRARLLGPEEPGPETVWLPVEGSLLASSEPWPDSRSGKLALQRNHAVISHSDSAYLR